MALLGGMSWWSDNCDRSSATYSHHGPTGTDLVPNKMVEVGAIPINSPHHQVSTQESKCSYRCSERSQRKLEECGIHPSRWRVCGKAMRTPAVGPRASLLQEGEVAQRELMRRSGFRRNWSCWPVLLPSRGVAYQEATPVEGVPTEGPPICSVLEVSK